MRSEEYGMQVQIASFPHVKENSKRKKFIEHLNTNSTPEFGDIKKNVTTKDMAENLARKLLSGK